MGKPGLYLPSDTPKGGVVSIITHKSFHVNVSSKVPGMQIILNGHTEQPSQNASSVMVKAI